MDKLIFKVIKSNDTTEESYQSALECARVSIESVLESEELIVKTSGNTISISHVIPGQPIGMSPSACKEKIKGCFCDNTGSLYPEFAKLEAQQ